MKKLLIYGFRPYNKAATNISEEIIKKLNGKYKIILPVKFDNSLIINKIRKIKPDIVIGFGMARKGRLIRIERRAKNIIKSKSSKTKINKKGAKKYFVNLKLKKIGGTRVSYDAGEYVCNYIMYSIMHYINKNKLKTKYALIHIPKNLKINHSLNVINKLLGDIKQNHF